MTVTGRRINTHEATVHTAAVYVKALMIEKRQVTLAVFRQLFQEDVIDKRTLEFNGIPWGLVNYHVDCFELAEHRHVVWARGEELRRCTVYSSGPREYLRFSIGRGTPVVTADWSEAQIEGWYGRYLELRALDQLFIAV